MMTIAQPTARRVHFEDQQHQQAAYDQVGRLLLAVAHVKRRNVIDCPDLNEDDVGNEQDVYTESNPPQPVPRIPLTDRFPYRAPKQREHADREYQHRAQVNGPERSALRGAEGCDVEVEDREADCDHGATKVDRIRQGQAPVQQQAFEKNRSRALPRT